MASNIKFKRSAVQNRVPTTAQLDLGELALNTYDGKLYTEINTGSAAVVEIGSKLSSLVVDGANGAGNGDVVFHGATAGRDLTWDHSINRLHFADNADLTFGDSNDLIILHNGNHSIIQDAGTGNLAILSNSLYLQNTSGNEVYLRALNNSAVDLYHDNSIRISTTADGADITGTGSLKLPVGTTAQRNSSPVAGDIRYNTTTGGFEGYSSSWGELGGGGIGIGSTSTNPASGVVANRIGVGFTDINVVGSGISVTGYGSTIVLDFNDFKPGSFHRTIHNYTATAGQTTFAGLNYVTSEKQIAVYLNGARLSESTYTATSGTTVVLDVGASVGDEVEIINIHTNSDVDRKVNTYTATAGQTTFTGLSYNSKQELDVYLNGIRLASADYTATSGSTVVLAVGASVNDTVDIVSTGDGVTFRSTSDASGDRFTFNNLGIGTDQTPNALNVVGVSTFTSSTFPLVVHADTNYQGILVNGNAAPTVSFAHQNTTTPDWKIGLSGGNHTALAISEGTGNTNRLTLNSGGGASISGTVLAQHLGIDGYLYHNSDTDTRLSFGTDEINLNTGGTTRIAITNTGASVTGNLNVSGVLTYDDVTNIDSVGIVTARSGIFIPNNEKLELSGSVGSSKIRLYQHSSLGSMLEFTSSSNGHIGHNASGAGKDITFNSGNDFIFKGLQSNGGVVNIARFYKSGQRCALNGDGAEKFTTTSYGIDVTGTTGTDGLVVSGVTSTSTIQSTGSLTITSASPTINLTESDADPDYQIKVSGGDFKIKADGSGKIIINADGHIDLIDHVDISSGLDVTGNAGVSGNISVGGVISIPDTIQHVNDTNTKIRFPAADTISMETAGSERLRIDSSGKLGVNVTSPSAQLHVENDNTNASTYYLNTDATVLIQNKNSNASAKTVLKLEGPVGGGDCAIVYGDSSANLIFSDRENERLRIDSSGKVGINESSPLGKLHVKTGDSGVSAVGSSTDELVLESATNTGMTILSGTANEGGINFGDSDDINIGKIAYNHSANAMFFKTNDIERLRIESDGGVNIGAGSGNQSTLAPILQLHKASSSATAYLHITNTDSGITNNDGLVIGFNGSNDALFFNKESTPIRFATGGTERLRITSTGLIRMGNGAEGNTESHITAAIFQNVTGTATILKLGNTNTPSSANNRAIEFCDGTGGTEGSSKYTYAKIKAERVSGSNDGQLIFYTKPDNSSNPTERIRIKSDGSTIFGSAGAANNSNTVSIHPSDGMVNFGMDGRSSYVTGTNSCYIYSGEGATGTTLAGELYLQSRSNVDRDIVFVTGSTPAERLRVHSSGALGIAGKNYGTAGQVLTSGGSGSPISWTTVTGTTINNNADNRVITGSGTANTLNAESGLLWDSTRLTVSGSTNQKIILQGATHPYIHFYEGTTGKAFIQWHADGYLRIKNDEDNATIRLKDSIQFSTDDSTFYTMWHAGNDGSGSGLDADTLDGVQGANYVRTNQNTTITSDLFISGGAGGITVNGGSDIRFSSGNWTGNTTSPKIQAHSDYLYIAGGPNGIIFRESGTDRWFIDGSGHFRPASNNQYDIGTSSYRVKNIYTQDLQLSNEAQKDTGGNDVDGTWGDWTLQEGESDVYMINNRSGKKFRIKMEEV